MSLNELALITHYFPKLTPLQNNQIAQLYPLYLSWNEKINVISRKDIESLYVKHVLHGLAIAKFIHFPNGTKVLDIGTGGGFPGIPLAILFPEVQFTLVDSIAKKIKVVNAVTESLGLKNVTAVQCRAETLKQKFHFIVSRAVTALPIFKLWVKGKFENDSIHPHIKNGVVYLKGGDLTDEIKASKLPVKLIEISDYFKEDFFIEKKILYIKAINFK